MSESMVRRLAKEIAVGLGEPNDDVGCEYLARAVLTAMREPTGAMEQAGWPAKGSGYLWDDWCPQAAWEAMIDAALEGK